MRTSVRPGLLPAAAVLVAAALELPVVHAQTSRPAPAASTGVTAIRIASSRDGLSFADDGEVLLQNASAPSAVRLPNGQILVVFDYAAGSAGATTLAVSRSSDGGRTWLRPRPLRWTGPPVRFAAPRHACLLLAPGGIVRVYFAADLRGPAARDPRGREESTLISAVTRNGIDYRLDPAVRIPLKPRGCDHAVAVRAGHRLDLYVDGLPAGGRKAGAAAHLVSTDGRRFRPLPEVKVPDGCLVGSIIPVGRGLRAYITAADGVRSATSTDGHEWTADPDVRVAGGSDPAVVALPDGSYLMLFCGGLNERSRRAPQLALQSPEPGGGATGAGSAAPAASPQTAPGGPDGGTPGGTPPNPWEPFASEADEMAMAQPDGPSGGDRTDASSAAEDADWAPDAGGADGFPPSPDFQTPVDYFAWLQEQCPAIAEGNAYDAYAAFMSMPGDAPGSKPEWPSFVNMYTTDKAGGPPGPWDPAAHPDWEASSQAAQWYLDQFRNAARFPYYAQPIDEQTAPPGPDGDRMLIGILLPSLAQHRTMVKTTLADAWRAEGGQVSPERMLGALETNLRAAGHMRQGFTLIHNLVGIAEGTLTRDDARRALQFGVFATPEQMEAGLRILQEHDGPPPDTSGWITFECAAALDATQWVFSAKGADGQPRVDVDRARNLLRMSAGDDSEETSQLLNLTADDARRTVDAFNGFYRELREKWRTGYPLVRSADLQEVSERYLRTTPLTAMFIPSLSRAYHLNARNEASRRATQLSYAVQIFKARNGRWPASLAELPPELGETIRIDPFTGNEFGYRIGENGPSIYTLSENGLDDGGVHSPRWSDNRGPDESDDHVFWPTQ